jgi:two-component system, NtrC family, response regulator AtoC
MPNVARAEDVAEGLRSFSGAGSGAGFVGGVSPSMRAVEAVIGELAQSEVPVLLLAEPGAGKHATARRIHEMSRRSGQPFRAVTCATYRATRTVEEPTSPEEAGWFKRGTVFLDELADLGLESQARIMELMPRAGHNGSSGSEGARLICGSARDLEIELKEGRLREDLYYRVSGVCLRLPPLRQRREDIPLLIEHFLEKYARDFRRPVPRLSAEAQHLFQDYSWPGNVKELENAARALVALGDEDIAMGGLRALLSRPEAGGNGARVSLKQAARAASRVAEKELILKVLTRTRWNRRRAAEELQISYKALLYKMKQIGCSEYGSS